MARRIKENGGGVNSRMIYLIYCKNFLNATIYSTQQNNKKKIH
jgi:hypothetical protein